MRIKTTVIGSYPKFPKLISDRFDTQWLVSPGEHLDKEWSNRNNLEELQKEAIKWAVKEQEDAGIDIVSDGEQKRGNFVLYHCQHLDGFDFIHKETKTIRGGSRSELVPTIRSLVRLRQLFLTSEFNFLKTLTKKEIKVTLPGPSTIIDSVKDLFYHDEKKLAFDIANVLREEIMSLVTAGCTIIQIDEPVFIREPKKFLDYGKDALEACFDGVDGITKEVHICRGYPNKNRNVKAEKNNYGEIVESLSKTTINRISIEDAHEHLNLEFFKKFGDKDIILGAVEVGGVKIESVLEIRERIQQVLTVIPPERLLVAPDCGLLLLSPEIAKAKLKNMVAAVREINSILGNFTE